MTVDQNDRVVLLRSSGFMWESVMLSLIAMSQRYELCVLDVAECFRYFGSIEELVEIYEGEAQDQQNPRL